MAERVWLGLNTLTANGLACVMCGRDFRGWRSPVRVPVGLSHTGRQVFTCTGECTARAAATPEVLAIPFDALTAAGIACLAVLEGGDPCRANLDLLVATIVHAGAPLVVAEELRRLATLATTGTTPGITFTGYVGAGVLHARADELDPGGAR